MLIKILLFFFFYQTVVFTCSKVINAFKRLNSWTDTFRKSSELKHPWHHPSTSIKTSVASVTQQFLVPVSTVSARNTWHNDLPFVSQKFRGEYFQKNWEGVCGTLLETLTLFQTKICDFPYPISDLIKNLIPYSRPEALVRDRSA